MEIIVAILLFSHLVMSINAFFGKGFIAYIIINHSRESERGNHDYMANCRFNGVVSIVSLLFLLILLFAAYRDILWLFRSSSVLFFLPMIAGMIYRLTGDRFLLDNNIPMKPWPSERH